MEDNLNKVVRDIRTLISQDCSNETIKRRITSGYSF